jgi:hypothetical protein
MAPLILPLKTLNRDEILGAIDIQRKLVDVWGGQVWVYGMTGAERDKYEGGIIQYRGKEQTVNMANIRAKLCSMTIRDEKGKRLFTEEDIQALSQKSAASLQKIFIVAQKLSGITDEDVKELSEGVKDNPFEGSASDSPVTSDVP